MDWIRCSLVTSGPPSRPPPLSSSRARANTSPTLDSASVPTVSRSASSDGTTRPQSSSGARPRSETTATPGGEIYFKPFLYEKVKDKVSSFFSPLFTFISLCQFSPKAKELFGPLCVIYFLFSPSLFWWFADMLFPLWNIFYFPHTV